MVTSDGSVSGRRRLGQRGEDAAAALVQDRGYTVLARNWRCREGEIDLIARCAGVLAFCEVKTRSGQGWGTAAAAVTPAKMRRLRRLARRWLMESDARADVIRFDVITVVVDPQGRLITDWLTGVSS